jgi:Right handed beta helix region
MRTRTIGLFVALLCAPPALAAEDAPTQRPSAGMLGGAASNVPSMTVKNPGGEVPASSSPNVPRQYEADGFIMSTDEGDYGMVVNRALAAASSGGVVNVSRGPHSVSTMIVLAQNNVTLVCHPGAILTRATRGGAVILVKGSNDTVTGCEINGAQMFGPGVWVTGSYNKIIGNYVHDTGRVSGGKFADYSQGIGVDGQKTSAMGNVIENNRVINASAVCISTNTVTYSKVLNNNVSNCGAEGVTLDTSVRPEVSQYNLVEGNHITGACAIGGVGGIGMDGASNNTVRSNIVSGSLHGCSGLKTQNNISSSIANEIDGNTFVGNAGYGWWLSNSGGYDSLRNVVGPNVTSANTRGPSRTDNAAATENSVK